jgi:glutamine amidotransferase
MCRFLAYHGEPVLLEELICAGDHSLIHQSLHAIECKTGTNGDGFGLGWYGERPTPGLFRDLRPAWADENLRSLCEQVRSPLFFAHVRAATGTATSRANCHPFAQDRWLFMHNGQIGNYGRVKRQLESALPDALYDARQGNTDSELLFLLTLARIAVGMAPAEALADVLGEVKALMIAAGVAEPLRFTATLSDGETLWAVRTACDGRPASLYLQERSRSVVIASEPLEMRREGWHAVAPDSLITVSRGGEVGIAPFFIPMVESRSAA